MNEPHFYLFFLHNFDLHNLQIEKRVRSVLNPVSEHRWALVNNKPIHDLVETGTDDEVDILTTELNRVEIVEECSYFCEKCDNKYKTQEDLTKHIETKHERIYTCRICLKDLKSKQALQRHQEKCELQIFTCKTCTETFSSEESLKEHKSTHTTCDICKKDLKFMLKLTRHMKVHQ